MKKSVNMLREEYNEAVRFHDIAYVAYKAGYAELSAVLDAQAVVTKCYRAVEANELAASQASEPVENSI